MEIDPKEAFFLEQQLSRDLENSEEDSGSEDDILPWEWESVSNKLYNCFLNIESDLGIFWTKITLLYNELYQILKASYLRIFLIFDKGTKIVQKFEVFNLDKTKHIRSSSPQNFKNLIPLMIK